MCELTWVPAHSTCVRACVCVWGGDKPGEAEQQLDCNTNHGPRPRATCVTGRRKVPPEATAGTEPTRATCC